jgi:hypothetical protein
MSPKVSTVAVAGVPVVVLLAALFWPSSIPEPFSAADIEAYQVSKYLTDGTVRSWEEGVWTEALLEVHNPELTVFAKDPFPRGRPPRVPDGPLETVPGLASAARYIQTDGDLLCDGEGTNQTRMLDGKQLTKQARQQIQHHSALRQSSYHPGRQQIRLLSCLLRKTSAVQPSARPRTFWIRRQSSS